MVHFNFYTQITNFIPQPVSIPFHFIFVRNQATAQDSTTQFVFLLKDSWFMSTKCGPSRSFHTSRTATNNRNFHCPATLLFIHIIKIKISTNWIDRACDILLCHQRFLPAACKARDTLTDLFRLAKLNFCRPIRISQRPTAHTNHISLAFSNYTLTKLRSSQSMADDYRYLYKRFYCFS